MKKIKRIVYVIIGYAIVFIGLILKDKYLFVGSIITSRIETKSWQEIFEDIVSYLVFAFIITSFILFIFLKSKRSCEE